MSQTITEKLPLRLAYFLSLLIVLTFYSFRLEFDAWAHPVAIDGISGFVGSSLLKDLDHQDLRAGCFHCSVKPPGIFQYFGGPSYSQSHLQNLLDGVESFYQVAAIASVEATVPLEQYILVNALGGFLASRMNKSMTHVVLSSIATTDVKLNLQTEHWIQDFVNFFSEYLKQSDATSESRLSAELTHFIHVRPISDLKPNQFYGFSKLLLERLLLKSSETRTGKTFIIRPALIVGKNIQNRRGSSVVKSIMDAVFHERHYELWNRMNCFTPISTVKRLMLYVAEHKDRFSNYEVFEAGCILMNQHDLARLILEKTKNEVSGLSEA